MKRLLPLWLHAIIDALYEWRSSTLIYFDLRGQPITLPAQLLPYAIEADDINAGAQQGDLGVLTLFGPYTSAQLRSVALIARESADLDMAIISIVAHTTWGTRDAEGFSEDDQVNST